MNEKDFPILRKKIYGKKLVYLDNASTTQKPKKVIDAIVNYYENSNSNVHRGIYFLSSKATDEYERARIKVQKFLNAKKSEEIVFTSGATEAINLVASSYGRFIKSGDEILISEMEHHSNIVPWQILCEEKNAKLKVIPINEKGELVWRDFLRMLNHKTKLVSIVQVSNSLGTVNPVKKIIEEAHKKGAVVLVDGAQAVAHMPVDVVNLDADFYVFSGHKIYGPTGIGILYGKVKYLNQMPPYQSGGDMISQVTFAKTSFNKIPYKFEAGTPNIAGAIGMGASIDYLNSFGFDKIQKHEKSLLKYAERQLSKIKGLKIIGKRKEKIGVISFVIEGIHPHDVGSFLDNEGIAVRTGQHCCQPVMNHFKIPATSRISLGLYNTKNDIDKTIRTLNKLIKIFK